MLDERSLWMVLVFVPGFLALATGSWGAQLGEVSRALRTWTVALALMTTVSVLYAAGATKGYGWVLLNNAFWIPIMVLMAVAPRQLAGLPDRTGVAVTAGLLMMGTVAVLGGEGVQTVARLSALALFHAGCLGLGLWALVRSPEASRSLGHLLAAAGLIIALAVQGLRLVQLWSGDALTVRFMQGDTSGLAVLLVVGMLGSFTLISVGLLLAVARRVNRALEALAQRDPLTGLLNRRGFAAQAVPLLALARRHRWPVAVAVIDIDDFRRVNSLHGHEGGDRALQRMGAILESHGRAGDLVSRFGGEEFVVLQLAESAESMASWAEALRELVAGNAHRDAAPGFTASIGWASASDAPSFEALYAAADAALYRAKQAGKNRVSC